MAIKVYKAGKKIAYAYKRNGLFDMHFSNNISALCVSGQERNSIQDQLVQLANVDINIVSLSDYCFNNCTSIVEIDLGQSLTSIGAYCFNKCTQIQNINLPFSLAHAGECAFSNAYSLTCVSFTNFENDIVDDATYELKSLGNNIFSNSPKMLNMVFPESFRIDSSTSNTALQGSSLTSITFLGISSSRINTITSTNCLGIGHDCYIYSSDDKKYKYVSSSNLLAIDNTYSLYRGIQIGKGGILRLRSIYKFEQASVGWCIDYTTRTTETKAEKFPQENCPIIVIYLDLKTSSLSQQYMENVILNSAFANLLKTMLNCYIFVLSRHDMNSSTVDVEFFKKTFPDYDRNFVSIVFHYNDKTIYATTNSLDIHENISLFLEKAEAAEFGSFNYEDFDIKLEEPYDEEIATGSIVTQADCIPWWYSGGTIMNIGEW